MPRDRSWKAAAAVIPADCHERPTWTGVAYLARAAAIYAASVAALLATDRPLALPPLWLLAGLAVGAFFVLGHDAAHGALFASPRLCRVVARLALLPSLHAYEPWVVGHNRIHHGHTGRRGVDFVWHPLTKDEYDGLPRWKRLVHRVEWMPGGAGLYYLRVLWWQRMMRLVPPPRLRRAFRRDRAVVLAYLAASSLAVLWLAGVGSAAGAAWTWTKVVLVPWLVWNELIGVTVYLHHIGPDVAWHEGRPPARLRAQLDGTTTYRIAPWLNVFWQNILVHAPHHVDPRVPFHALPRAADALARRFPDAIRERPLRVGDYVRIARRCKLYRFADGAWLGYDGTPVATSSPSRSIGAETAR
jgi:acyl-lipid omega-6 desaturase (Delta-12 desaturase)